MTSHAGKLNLKMLLVLLPVLLLVAVAVNYASIMSVVKGERSLKSVFYGLQDSSTSEFGMIPLPDKPIGSEKAKVTIDMFLRGGDGCHVQTIFLGQALGTVDPERIKIVFNDTASPTAQEKFNKLKLGCEQGMAVNSKVKFKVPNTPTAMQTGAPMPPEMQPSADGKPATATDGKKKKEKTIYLTGGHEMKWSMADLYFILNNELKTAYKKGLAMDADEFTKKVRDGQSSIMDAAREKAKLGKQRGPDQAPQNIMPTDAVKQGAK